jgi:hypothetical protein
VTRGSSVELEGVRVELEGVRVELEGAVEKRPGTRQTHIMIVIIIKTKTPPITKNLMVLFLSGSGSLAPLDPGVGRVRKGARWSHKRHKADTSDDGSNCKNHDSPK